MKKTLSILAIALTVGLIGYQLANAGPGRGRHGGWGPDGCNGPNANAENCKQWQAFKEDTADLRKQLREKRHEYFTLMKSDKVDKDVAQALWSDMFDLKAQMREKAADDGVDLAQVFDRNRRGGHGCNGPRGVGYFTDGPSGVGPDDAPCPNPADCPNSL